MSSRTARDNANAVSLFPFLAVLLCTMGALLVLLVVLAQRAADQAGRTAESTVEMPPNNPPATTPSEANDAQSLALLRRRRTELEQRQTQLEERINSEKTRLAHLEEHNRRIEHDLALLYVAHEQLKNTEDERLQDQQQAKRELDRLRELIDQSELAVAKAREKAASARHKAVILYRGPSGTVRPPVYIECHAEGVTLQPEGVPLEADDFVSPLRPGNALALAIRATQEHAFRRNLRNGQSGEAPYPLVIVRPGGGAQYNRVIRALQAADMSYGYEFVGGDTELAYPNPDPELAQTQHHAVMQARDRQALLARAAPSRFRTGRAGKAGRGGRGGGGGFGHGMGPGHGNIGGGGAGGLGIGLDADATAVGGGRYGEILDDAGRDSDGMTGGNAEGPGGGGANGGGWSSSVKTTGDGRGDAAGNQGNQGPGNDSGADRSARGELAFNGGGAGRGGSGRGTGANDNSQQGAATSNGAAPGDSGGAGANVANASSGGQSGGASSGPANQASARGGTPGGGNQAPAEGAQNFSASPTTQSIAASRGSGWATGARNSRAVPVRRPIAVSVLPRELVVTPEVDGRRRSGRETRVSLDQHSDRVLEEFVTAVRRRIDQWGLAGRGMVWRPVLNLRVAPGAELQARKLARALEDSGIDVNLPQVARQQGAMTHETR